MSLFSPPKAGLHFGKDYLSFAVLRPAGRRFVIKGLEVIPLSKNSIRHSPIELNILNPEEIRGHLKRIFSDYPEIKSISLSLPDLSSRMILFEIKRIIPPLNELNQLIKWNIEQKFIMKVGESCYSHQLICQSDHSLKKENRVNGSGKYFYILGTAVLKNILSEYENVPASFQVISKMINSASLNLFNLYHDFIFKKAEAGHFMFLSVLDNYFTLMVFENKVLQYIRTVGLRLPEGDEKEGREAIEENNRLKMINHIESVLPYHYQDVHSKSEIQLFLTGPPEAPKAVLQLADQVKLAVTILTPELLASLEDIGKIHNREMAQLIPAIAAAAGALN